MATPSPRRTVARLALEHRRSIAAVLTGVAVLAGLTSIRSDTSAADGRTVLAAARDLPSGQRLKAADVRVVRLPGRTVPRAALTQRTQAVGRRLAGAVRAGELLTDRRVLGRGALDGVAGDAVLTTIRLGDADGLGAVRVGEAVDVVAVDPDREEKARVVARGLVVLARRSADGTDGALVDLAADEQEALVLAEAGLRSRLTVLVSTATPEPG